jgi:spermidine synthase
MSDLIRRAVSARGELVVRRRTDDGALELRVNGVFVTDTAQTCSERTLAAAALAAVPTTRDRLAVLVGGLGLGFTLAEVLADPRVELAVVAEIEADLVAWHREGLVDETAWAVRDPRTHVETDDVRRVVASRPRASLDLLLLDVDNGPGYLVYDANASLYRRPFLRTCLSALRPGGVLAVWSAADAPELASELADVFEGCERVTVPVRLGNRQTAYHVLIGRAAD